MLKEDVYSADTKSSNHTHSECFSQNTSARNEPVERGTHTNNA